MPSYDFTFKVILLGDASVGKTRFTKRYCINLFNPSERLTIGVDFYVKTIDLHGKKIKLQIWDIGVEERFRFLLPTYCLGANAAFILYDITRPQTLDSISEWTNIVLQKGGFIPIGLVGMQLHKEIDRKATREEALKKVKRLNMDFYVEASAKTGQNIEKIFQVLIDILF